MWIHSTQVLICPPHKWVPCICWGITGWWMRHSDVYEALKVIKIPNAARAQDKRNQKDYRSSFNSSAQPLIHEATPQFIIRPIIDQLLHRPGPTSTHQVEPSAVLEKKKRKRKAKSLLGLPVWKHQNQERRICWMFKYRERETKRDREREDREDPHVNSHWGQRTVTALTKANSLEERSTSPVTVDHSIITSTGLTVSLRPTARSSYDRHAEWRQIWKVKLQRISQLRGENNQPLGRYSQGQKVALFDQICEKLMKEDKWWLWFGKKNY